MSKLKYSLFFATLGLATLVAAGLGHLVAGKEPPATPTASPGPERVVAAGRGRIDVEGGMIQISAQRDGVMDEVFVYWRLEVPSGELKARK
ncbi:MAG: hypothetical protein ACT60Q_20330, partial [Ferrovibrionaceae bacterium]